MVVNNGLGLQSSLARFERVGDIIHVRDLSTVIQRRSGQPAGEKMPRPAPGGGTPVPRTATEPDAAPRIARRRAGRTCQRPEGPADRRGPQFAGDRADHCELPGAGRAARRHGADRPDGGVFQRHRRGERPQLRRHLGPDAGGGGPRALLHRPRACQGRQPEHPLAHHLPRRDPVAARREPAADVDRARPLDRLPARQADGRPSGRPARRFLLHPLHPVRGRPGRGTGAADADRALPAREGQPAGGRERPRQANHLLPRPRHPRALAPLRGRRRAAVAAGVRGCGLLQRDQGRQCAHTAAGPQLVTRGRDDQRHPLGARGTCQRDRPARDRPALGRDPLGAHPRLAERDRLFRPVLLGLVRRRRRPPPPRSCRCRWRSTARSCRTSSRTKSATRWA